MTYKRKISNVERVHAAIGCSGRSLLNPSINQLVVQGQGVFDVNAWRRAIHTVAKEAPGCCLIKKGHLGFSYWHASGPVPRITHIERSDWDGLTGDNAPFLDQPLDVLHGPSVEIVLVETKRKDLFVVLRTHHAIMDGVGTTTFLFKLFSALNKENVQQVKSSLTESEIIRSIKSIAAPSVKVTSKAVTPFGKIQARFAPDEKVSRIWSRISIPGRQPHLLQKTMLLFAQIARSYDEHRAVHFAVPTNLRRHAKNVVSTANLTGMMLVDVSCDDTVFSLKRKMAEKLKANEDLYRPKVIHLIPWLPLKVIDLISSQLNKLMRRSRAPQKRNSALISYMDVNSEQKFDAAGFESKSLFFIPVNVDVPAFSVLTSHSFGNDLVIGVPSYIDKQALSSFVTKIEEYFSATQAEHACKTAEQ